LPSDALRSLIGQVLKRGDIYALIGLLGFTILLLWPYLFTWPTPLIFPVSDLGTDLPREVWPLARFAVDTLRQTGTLPLWRPYLLSGAPLIGHPVAPVLYPPHWLALVLPLPLALNLNAAFHLWWSGVGTYLYLRFQSGKRWEAAFLGALIFAHSPRWIASLSGGHWPTIAAIAWWPWAWLGFSRYWATGRASWIVLLGVALSVQALTDGRYFVLSTLWIGGCTFGFVWRDGLSGLRRAAIGWSVALAVMFGLAAGQLLPFLELLPYANRAALTQAEAAFGSLSPILLLGVLFPPELKFPEWFLFPGVGALLLATLGWASGWSRRERWWAIGGFVGLIMSLGASTPLYGLLYRVVPGFGLFRVPARWWLFTLFALAVLAAWGAEKWLNQAIPRKRRVAAALLSLALIYLTGGGLEIAAPQLLAFDIIPSILPVLLTGALLARSPSKWRFAALSVILFADVWWTSAGLIRPEPETNLTAPDEAATFLQSSTIGGERSFAPYAGLSAPRLVNFNLRAADGYDSFQLTAYAELARRASGCHFVGYAVAVPPTQASPEAVRACPKFRPERRLLALLNARYVILPTPTDMAGAKLALADSGRWVYDLGPGLGRAFGVSRGEVVSDMHCLDDLVMIDPSVEAVVESPLPFETNSAPPVVIAREMIVNGEEFRVQVNGAGLLIRSEAWAPGWGATVDGEVAEVLRVDCALQGVWLDVGEHHVRFEYAPRGYEVGRWISLVMVLILLGWSGWLMYRFMQRKSHATYK